MPGEVEADPARGTRRRHRRRLQCRRAVRRDVGLVPMDRDGLDWPRYALIRTGPARSLHVRLRKPQIPDPPLTGPAPLSPHRAPSALASATGDADELPFGQLGLQLEDGRRVAQREPDVRLRGFSAVRVPRRVSRRSYTRGAENDHRPDNPSNPAPSCHRPCFLLRFRLTDRFRQVSPGVCRTGIRSRYGARPVVLTVGTLTTPQRAHPREANCSTLVPTQGRRQPLLTAWLPRQPRVGSTTLDADDAARRRV
jgi:hypothetical protein